VTLGDQEVASVAVLVHDDVDALHFALVVAHSLPETLLVVTVFDRTLGDEIMRLLPRCSVKCPADIVASPLADLAAGGALPCSPRWRTSAPNLRSPVASGTYFTRTIMLERVMAVASWPFLA
jgi:hypothetical protein